MNRRQPSDDEARITREAADWIVREDAGLTRSETESRDRWLAADLRNEDAYVRSSREWAGFSIAAQCRPHGQIQPDADLLAPHRRPPRPLVWLLPLAAAALLTVGLFAHLSDWNRSPHATATLSTVIPHERRFLADGSVLDLEAAAEAEVLLTPGRRTVRLLRGSAHFDVAHDPQRPFVVEVAGGLEVRAVGTAFDVRLGSDHVDVRVTEGKVQVGSLDARENEPPIPLLVAGQRLRAPFDLDPTQVSIDQAAPAGQPSSLTRPDWYEFEAVPLGKVIAEFNRHGGPTLVIEDEELRQMPVYVAFRAENLDSLISLLEATGRIKAERTSHEVRIRPVP